MKRAILPLVGCLATGALAQAPPSAPAPVAPAAPPALATPRVTITAERQEGQTDIHSEQREQLQRQIEELAQKLRAATAAKDTAAVANHQKSLARLQAELDSLKREHLRSINLNGLFLAEGVTLGPTVTLQLDDTSPREAFLKVLEAGKLEHEFVGEIPNEPRLTLKVEKIRVTTALRLVGEVAGVGIVRIVKGDKAIYRIGGPPHRQFSAQPILGAAPTIDSLRLEIPGTYTISGGSTRLRLPAPPTSHSMERYFFTEERAAFNCPHCKGHVTVLRNRQQPDCPKCARQFQPTWQYCPNDGTKRPETAGKWKFCPLCGKSVKMQQSNADSDADSTASDDFLFTPEGFAAPQANLDFFTWKGQDIVPHLAQPSVPAPPAVPVPPTPEAPPARTTPKPRAFPQPKAPETPAVPAPPTPEPTAPPAPAGR